MSAPDTDANQNDKEQKKLRGIFTLVMLIFAAAAGGCYFAATLK